MDMRSNLESGHQVPNGDLDDTLKRELESLLQQRNRLIFGQGKDLDMRRSGSAPPIVEGLLRAMDNQFLNSDIRDINNITSSCSNSCGILSDDELRWHPAYLSYYYSNEHANPRLPPPLLSKEDWRVAQRFQSSEHSFNGAGGWRKKLAETDDGSSSLFSVQPGIPVEQAENDLMELRNAVARNHSRKMPVEWHDRSSEGLIGLSGTTGLGLRRKSFADILQEGLDGEASLSSQLSRPASCNTFRDITDPTILSNLHLGGFCNGLESCEAMHSGAAPSGLLGVQKHAKAVPTSTLGSSVPRNKTPESHLVGRSTASGLPPIGTKVSPIEKKNAVGCTVQNSGFCSAAEVAEVATTLSRLNRSEIGQLQLDLDNHSDLVPNMSNGHKQSLQQQLIDRTKPENLLLSTSCSGLVKKSGITTNLGASTIGPHGQANIPKRTSSSTNLYSMVNSSGLGSSDVSNAHIQNANIHGTDFIGPGAYTVKQNVNSTTKNQLSEALPGGGNRPSSGRLINSLAPDSHSPIMDPRYIQYLQRINSATSAAASPNDPSLVRNNAGTLCGDLGSIQKEYLALLLAQNKQQYDMPLLGNSVGLSHRFYGNPSYDTGIMYPANPMAFPPNCSRNFHNDRVLRSTAMMKNIQRGSQGSSHLDIGSTLEGRYPPSLLDELKNDKTRSLELSNIVGHVIEFSMDQYGSRFIQQKLETATEEEKNQIFPEIIPSTRTLMTDVFGNYVIQKFFENGTESQRKELASQLTGFVLPLSLQMYGCRVIQKALEVVDVDQQAQMVNELDGAVMKCVHDQNGNHVIQKCIECVPQDRIQFIISAFYGQVVALSTHPYGCRVIQRVLEHCDDPKTQQIIVDEVMQSVCLLAQDQYGNYVIQHVIEHGKPHERSEIISKLAGQIVKMSQQKFASNVVEKCLTFGGPEERQILVKEMLGSTDDNEPLQAMMKDPFGNYVVQKVLETCDNQSLELILSRIKVHLNALKRYTYGKHIVSRVEKLITTGERRIRLSSSSLAPAEVSK